MTQVCTGCQSVYCLLSPDLYSATPEVPILMQGRNMYIVIISSSNNVDIKFWFKINTVGDNFNKNENNNANASEVLKFDMSLLCLQMPEFNCEYTFALVVGFCSTEIEQCLQPPDPFMGCKYTIWHLYVLGNLQCLGGFEGLLCSKVNGGGRELRKHGMKGREGR